MLLWLVYHKGKKQFWLNNIRNIIKKEKSTSRYTIQRKVEIITDVWQQINTVEIIIDVWQQIHNWVWCWACGRVGGQLPLLEPPSSAPGPKCTLFSKISTKECMIFRLFPSWIFFRYSSVLGHPLCHVCQSMGRTVHILRIKLCVTYIRQNPQMAI